MIRKVIMLLSVYIPNNQKTSLCLDNFLMTITSIKAKFAIDPIIESIAIGLKVPTFINKTFLLHKYILCTYHLI